MDLDIRRLSPDQAEAYVHFFDVTPHDENVAEHKCYCVLWRSDDSYAGYGDHWFPTRAERRERALQFVRDGSLQGYLAYRGGEIVGWCNANASCGRGLEFLRTYWPIEPPRADVRVKSVFCFVVAPQVQRKGVATQLLERVCQDAAMEGFDFVEAYANKAFTDPAHEFNGPLAMYLKCGFRIVAERDGRAVVRKALK